MKTRLTTILAATVLLTGIGLCGEAKREMVFDQPYLNLPVKNGAPKRRMRVVVEGATVRDLDIELADAEPAQWVFLDVSPWLGKRRR